MGHVKDVRTPSTDPRRDLPVQAIPPEVAVAVARAVNCRLPTSREWALAFEQHLAYWKYARQSKPVGWNLRDMRWTENGVGGRFPLSKDIFLPTGMADSPAIFERDRLPGWTVSDEETTNFLFPKPEASAADQSLAKDMRYLDIRHPLFRKCRLTGQTNIQVNTGIHDLIGNVAEFVFDDPVLLSGLTNRPSADELKELLKGTGSPLGMKVIGGSAFSPPEVNPTIAYKLSDQAGAAGFSDVGFRLAFDESPQPVLAWMRLALRHAKFIPGPGSVETTVSP